MRTRRARAEEDMKGDPLVKGAEFVMFLKKVPFLVCSLAELPYPSMADPSPLVAETEEAFSSSFVSAAPERVGAKEEKTQKRRATFLSINARMGGDVQRGDKRRRRM